MYQKGYTSCVTFISRDTHIVYRSKMKRIPISLTKQQNQHVEKLVEEGRYNSKAEYFRDKVREDMPKTTQKPEVPA